MAKGSQAKGSAGKSRKPMSKGPPQNFVISWREAESGPVLGYAMVELVAYFPTAVEGQSGRVTQHNASDPAFARLFAQAMADHTVLAAVALPSGSVSDADFQVDVKSMSG